MKRSIRPIKLLAPLFICWQASSYAALPSLNPLDWLSATKETLSATKETLSNLVPIKLPPNPWQPLPSQTQGAAPCSDYNPNKNPYFGDLHVHTALSFDALPSRSWVELVSGSNLPAGKSPGLMPPVLPADAYDYAKGNKPSRELLGAARERPLDFMAVTDHSEYLAQADVCYKLLSNPSQPLVRTALSNTPYCQLSRTRETHPDQQVKVLGMGVIYILGLSGQFTPGLGNVGNFCALSPAFCKKEETDVWKYTQTAANKANDSSASCKFSTFNAYEWTGTPLTANMHRNVIFRSDKVVPNVVSYLSADSPKDLWKALNTQCLKANGCEWLSIPHNPNLSGGLMFPDLANKSAEYIDLRAASEPLVEMIQEKGNSECSNSSTSAYGSNDEECDYRPNKGRLACDPQRPTPNCLPLCKTPVNAMGSICVEPNDFIRPGLRKGIEAQKLIGKNPYKLGFVGSTDTHNGAGGATDNWIGAEQPAAWAEGGLAVVWSEQNRRETLFANMRKKETYATSGSRPILRFFAGWSLDNVTQADPDWVSKAYKGGVPMGGTFNRGPSGKTAPTFVVSAFMDAGTARHPGTPLERAQIVKIWTTGTTSKEKVFNVAGSSTVSTPADALNLDTCRPTVTGSASLFTAWKDPEFDPSQHASYYVRLIEKPSCTHETYVLNASLAKLGLSCRSAKLSNDQALACKARGATRNRAWSSPIWYEPS